MARYRGIFQAAVALVLFLPAAQRADAQDMLVIDSGGARWKSGESREPPVTVDFGIVDSLAPDRRPTATRRQDRRPRRYLTLNIPQPIAPIAIPRPEGPAATGQADASPPPADATAALSPAAAAPVAKPQADAAPEPEPAAAPAATPQAEAPAPPAEAQTPPARVPKPMAEAQTPPAGTQTPPARAERAEPPAEAQTPAVSAPPSRPAALPARRLPAGKTEATPALRAFLDRAAGKRPAATAAIPSEGRAGAKLPPPPRPIMPRRTETAAAKATAPKPATPSRFKLPPPAPATGTSTPGAVASASGDRLPPPPPATDSTGTRVLPPRARPTADASATPRRRLALDAARRAPGAAPALPHIYSVSFFYEGGGLTLGADERERLRNVAARANGEEGLGVEIRAYSGSGEGGGVEARRQALSRAMEVRRLLIAAGVPDARILARAAGAGEGQGGRVDIVLVRRS